MDKKLLDILACPICKGKLDYNKTSQELICKFDKLANPIRDGIPIMLEDQARSLTADEGQRVMDFHVVIPVRYASQRLPGKALLDIAGKPMIQRVYERAAASGAETVVIATDDERIKEVAESFGAPVCMTSVDHQSGSERIAEAVVALGYQDDDVVVNVQGDEPLIPPTLIKQVAQGLIEHDSIKMATLCEPIKNSEDLFNPHIVKVTMNRRGYALYFSRAPIPWVRDQFPLKANQPLEGEFYRHIGLYAYRVGFLQEYVSWGIVSTRRNGSIRTIARIMEWWPNSCSRCQGKITVRSRHSRRFRKSTATC